MELGCSVFQELVEDFIFPASRLMLHLQRTGELCEDQAVPVCNTPLTTSAAFDFLVGLCVSCVPNMKLLVHMLTDMFYSGLFAEMHMLFFTC
jgi:ubiquitin carboxyl-terminal hydrolase 9/24